MRGLGEVERLEKAREFGSHEAYKSLAAEDGIEAYYEHLLVALSLTAPFVADADGNLIAFHQRWSEFTGQSADECDGVGWLDALHPDCRASFMTAMKTAVKVKDPLNARIRCRTRDGNYRWLLVRGAAHVEGQAAVRCYGVAAEIHNQAGEGVDAREREEHHRHFIELNPQILWTANAGGRIGEVGPRWAALTGLDRTAGAYLSDALSPDDLASVRSQWNHSVATGEPFDAEYRLRLADGDFRWFRSRAAACRAHTGEVLRWYGTLEDIHDRKLAEQAYRESEEHYRYSVELSAQIQWTASSDGAIDMAGPRWQAVTGQGPHEALGEGWTKQLHPDDASGALEAWVDSVRTGAQYATEFRLRTADGSYRWFRVQAAPRRDEAGNIIRWYGTAEDVHERQVAEQALRESEEHYRYSVELSPHRAWTTDANGLLVEMCSKWLAAVGMSEMEVRGHGWLKAVHPEDLPATRQGVSTAFAVGQPFGAELRIRMKDGTYRWQRAEAAPRRNEKGEIVRWYGKNTDIHDLVLVRQALQESEERFRLAAQAARLGVWDYDCVAAKHTWSDELRSILGVAANVPAAVGVALGHVLPEDRWQIEQFLEGVRSDDFACRLEATVRIRRSNDGALRWVTTNGWKTAQGGKLSRIIVTVRDVTEEKTAEERIRWIATHDALTRLPNRVLFQEELIQALEQAKAATGKAGLLLVDVDHFKQINDTLGHDAGDALLQALGPRMRASLRAGDMVARLGGDEFAIILPDVGGEDCITTAVNSIMARLREPLIHGGRIVDCRATIGASLYPDHASDAEELLKNADIALYSAKAAGRGRMAVFRPAMREDMQRRSSMLFLARDALERHLIKPYYQPKVDMKSGRLVGFEALLRWSHPRSGLQLPGTIAAAFEDLDLANAISDRMFDCVIGDLRLWLDAGLLFGHVAVNASAAEFRHDDLAERILGRLEAACVPARYLEVEVTESVFLGRGSEHIERALRKLSAAGVRIALDDFGTGFASLSHLKKFPIDVIKIDRSFVSNIELDQDNAAIVNAVLGLGRSLGIRVVAEGIENMIQADYLKQQGCDYGQGWLYAKAQPASDIPKLVDGWPSQFP